MTRGQAKTIYTAAEVDRMVQTLAQALVQAHPQGRALALVGIRTGGVHLARRLQALLAKTYAQAPELGFMDITLYRDDWTRLHHRPKVGKTEMDFAINDRVVVLVDDVLFTGRTVRAAMDELMDFGRPRRIELAVLVDRGHRELPIEPDYVGAEVATSYQQAVDVLFKEEGHTADSVVLRGV